jgi:hypothetical protein
MIPTESLPKPSAAPAAAPESSCGEGTAEVKPLSARQHEPSGAAAEPTATKPGADPRVIGYLRSIREGAWEEGEQTLRQTAAHRGYHLIEVVRSTSVSTLTSGCPGIMRILELVDQHEVDGVLTLADYTIAWDTEVVRRIAARIRARSAFLDFVWTGQPTAPVGQSQPQGAR